MVGKGTTSAQRMLTMVCSIAQRDYRGVCRNQLESLRILYQDANQCQCYAWPLGCLSLHFPNQATICSVLADMFIF